MSPVFYYRLYGFSVKSFLSLGLPQSRPAPCDLELTRVENHRFEGLVGRAASFESPQRFYYRTLSDGSDYIRFFDLFDFWVAPDGKKIVCRNLRKSQPDSFGSLGYLQANVFSFALIKMGMEPLHATAVVVDGKAVGFVGEGGLGKSTLAASFLATGFRLLTDDVLVIRKKRASFSAASGVSRIKLFPETAGKVLRLPLKGYPMNPGAQKLVFPLPSNRVRSGIFPLKALYVLRSSPKPRKGKKIMMRRLKGREAGVEMIRAAYNLVIQSPERLRNLFHFTAELASAVPIYELSYPRDFSRLEEVKRRILEGLRTSAVGQYNSALPETSPQRRF